MKVAVLHDYFDKYGGGEKVAITLAKAFDADIITGFVDHKNTYPEIDELSVKEISKKSRIPVIPLMKKFEKIKLEYDFFVFSGTVCIAANHNRPNMWYCHTPARYLYDLRDWYDKNSGIIGKIAISQIRRLVLKKDQMYAKRFDTVIANSKNVRDRIEEYYEIKNTQVIYPPTDVKKFRNRKSEDFYLSTARLDKLKRVDMIVRAFQKMPGKRLVIVSSGPEKNRIEKLAEGHGNIEIMGWVDEKEYIDLLSRCTATIYIPINEDSGISPVESMAAGKPCIVSDDGGVIETITDGKTGVHIRPTIQSVKNAVEALTPEAAKKMRATCIRRSRIFSEENFIKAMKKQVRSK